MEPRQWNCHKAYASNMKAMPQGNGRNKMTRLNAKILKGKTVFYNERCRGGVNRDLKRAAAIYRELTITTPSREGFIQYSKFKNEKLHQSLISKTQWPNYLGLHQEKQSDIIKVPSSFGQTESNIEIIDNPTTSTSSSEGYFTNKISTWQSRYEELEYQLRQDQASLETLINENKNIEEKLIIKMKEIEDEKVSIQNQKESLIKEKEKWKKTKNDEMKQEKQNSERTRQLDELSKSIKEKDELLKIEQRNFETKKLEMQRRENQLQEEENVRAKASQIAVEAKILMQQRAFDQAEEKYQHLIKITSNNPYAAAIKFFQAKADIIKLKAVENYKEFLELQQTLVLKYKDDKPILQTIYEEHMVVLINRHESEHALALCQSLLQITPVESQVTLYFREAEIFMSMKYYYEARKSYFKALKLAGNLSKKFRQHLLDEGLIALSLEHHYNQWTILDSWSNFRRMRLTNSNGGSHENSILIKQWKEMKNVTSLELKYLN